MKHNNDTTHVEHNTFSKKPLRYRVAFLLVVALFCCVVLAISNQTFSRTDCEEKISFDSLSLVQPDSQVSVGEEKKNDLSAIGSLPASSIFTKLSVILDVSNSIITLILKIACIYLLIETAKCLAYYRKRGKLRRCSKKKLKKRGGGTSKSFSKGSPNMGKSSRNIRLRGVIGPFNPHVKYNADPVIRQPPNILDFSDSSVTDRELKTPESDQGVEECQQEASVFFDFQDESKAMKIMMGDFKQGPIYFVKVINGALEGIPIHSGHYQIYPKMREVTEAELNYSSIKACFEIDRRVDSGKKFKIRFDQPAILAEEKEKIYIIQKKGKLTVTDTIE